MLDLLNENTTHQCIASLLTKGSITYRFPYALRHNDAKNITPSLFPLLSWITTENKTELKKLFISTTKSGGSQHHKHTNCT